MAGEILGALVLVLGALILLAALVLGWEQGATRDWQEVAGVVVVLVRVSEVGELFLVLVLPVRVVKRVVVLVVLVLVGLSVVVALVLVVMMLAPGAAIAAAIVAPLAVLTQVAVLAELVPMGAVVKGIKLDGFPLSLTHKSHTVASAETTALMSRYCVRRCFQSYAVLALSVS